MELVSAEFHNGFSATISLGLTQLAVASSPATYLPSFSLLEAKKGWIGDWEWDEAYNNITTFNVSYTLLKIGFLQQCPLNKTFRECPTKISHLTWFQEKKNGNWQSYYRAVATGPVSPVSTRPLFPSPMACLVSPNRPMLGKRPWHAHSVATCCNIIRDGCEQCERPSLPTIFRSSNRTICEGCGL